MPEAAVDENRLAPASEHDIRPSGQVLAMEAIAISHGVEATPDDHLRLCVTALDRLHDAPALLGGAGVHGDECRHCSVGQGRLDSIMSKARLVEAIAVVHDKLIPIHPFREENGRLSRLLADVMALQADRQVLDYTRWDERRIDYFAEIQACLNDYEPMKRLIRQALREKARTVGA